LALHAMSRCDGGAEFLASTECVRVLCDHLRDSCLRMDWPVNGLVCGILHRVCAVRGFEGVSPGAVSAGIEVVCAHMDDECEMFGANARNGVLYLHEVVKRCPECLNARQLSCIKDRANTVLELFKEGGVHHTHFLDSDRVVAACQDICRLVDEAEARK
jgi:hypothetical protein